MADKDAKFWKALDERFGAERWRSADACVPITTLVQWIYDQGIEDGKDFMLKLEHNRTFDEDGNRRV